MKVCGDLNYNDERLWVFKKKKTSDSANVIFSVSLKNADALF